MGAWIEINIFLNRSISSRSLPLWERGLKYGGHAKVGAVGAVAPLVGAWIEITQLIDRVQSKGVAPLVGAWIEMEKTNATWDGGDVAPLVGAWIEIFI